MLFSSLPMSSSSKAPGVITCKGFLTSSLFFPLIRSSKILIFFKKSKFGDLVSRFLQFCLIFSCGGMGPWGGAGGGGSGGGSAGADGDQGQSRLHISLPERRHQVGIQGHNDCSFFFRFTPFSFFIYNYLFLNMRVLANLCKTFCCFDYYCTCCH